MVYPAVVDGVPTSDVGVCVHCNCPTYTPFVDPRQLGRSLNIGLDSMQDCDVELSSHHRQHLLNRTPLPFIIAILGDALLPTRLAGPASQLHG